jgi:hypothetical protein
MKGGPFRQASSASSIRRASACCARAFSEIAGHDKSRDRMLHVDPHHHRLHDLLVVCGITYQ